MPNPKYKDTGCRLNPTCLDCPIPTNECPSLTGKKHTEMEQRNSRIRQLFEEGKSTKELVELFGLLKS